jgi:hypothetical protein
MTTRTALRDKAACFQGKELLPMIPFQEPLSVTLPRNTAFLPPLLKMGTCFFEHSGASRERSLRMQLALEEIFMMLSPQDPPSLKAPKAPPLEITFRRAPLGVRITVTDPQKEGLSPGELEERNSPELEEMDAKLGGFLLKKMADLVSFHQQGEEGNSYHLFFSLEEKSSSQAPLQSSPLPPKEIRVLQVGSLLPEEAPRGASFMREYAPETLGQIPWISPEKLRNLILSEKLLPCTVRNQEGEIFGFGGLLFQEETPGMPRMIPPGVHRSLSFPEIGGQIIPWLLDQALSQGCFGVTALLPSEEETALKLFANYGFARYARIPNSFGFTRHSPGKPGDLLCRILGKPEFPPFFASWKDERNIKPLLENAGLSPVFARPQMDVPLSGRSILHITVSPSEQRGEIRVLHFGVDLFLQTRQTLQHLRKLSIPGVLLKLPLEKPQTSLFAEKFHEIGFTPCGISPNFPGGMEILYYLSFTP